MPLAVCPPFTPGEGDLASGLVRLSQKAANPPGQTLFAGISIHPSGVERLSIDYDRVNVPGTIALESSGNHGSHFPHRGIPGSLAC